MTVRALIEALQALDDNALVVVQYQDWWVPLKHVTAGAYGDEDGVAWETDELTVDDSRVHPAVLLGHDEPW